MFRTLKDTPYKPLTAKKVKCIPTGIDRLDNAINGLESGNVIVITGRPSEGKSTFTHNIILNAIDVGKKVALIDGEYERDRLYNHLFRKVIGNDPRLYRKVQVYKKELVEPKERVLEQLHRWFSDRLLVFSKYDAKLEDFTSLFQLTKLCCTAHKVDLVVFDNLMSLVDSTNAELNAKQSKFMKQCTSLAKSANVAVVLVAHPNSTAGKGQEIDYYQISGTADIPNLTDVALQVIKDPLESNGSVMYDGRVVVLKNRHYSDYPKINLAYDRDTMALCEIQGDVSVSKSYDWRMEGKRWQQSIEF